MLDNLVLNATTTELELVDRAIFGSDGFAAGIKLAWNTTGVRLVGAFEARRARVRLNYRSPSENSCAYQGREVIAPARYDATRSFVSFRRWVGSAG